MRPLVSIALVILFSNLAVVSGQEEPDKPGWCVQLYECEDGIRSRCEGGPSIPPENCVPIGTCDKDSSCPPIVPVPFPPKPNLWEVKIYFKFCGHPCWHHLPVIGEGSNYCEAKDNACLNLKLYAKYLGKHVQCYKICVSKKPCSAQPCKKLKCFRLFRRR